MSDINPLTYYLFCEFVHFSFLLCIKANNINISSLYIMYVYIS